MLRASLISLAVLLTGTFGHAQAEPRRHAVHGVIGLWTPVGELGAEAEVAVSERISVSAGMGAAISGVQVAAMPRYHVPLGPRTWLGLGLGVSAGRYQWEELCIDGGCSRYTTDIALWSNAEMSVEWQPTGRLSVRGFAGVGRQLNPGAATCASVLDGAMCPDAIADDQNEMIVLPSLGLAIGSTF